MKKNQFWLVMILVFGLTITTCDNGDNDDGQEVAPTITTTLLPNGTVGTAYTQTLAATGDTPITWSVESGTLPAGLNLAATGTISGTPTTAETSTFTVKATNTAGNNTRQLSIIVTGSGSEVAPTITTTSLPNGTAGTAYSQTLAATGDTPITWSVESGTLPAGLSLAATGTISGTPTAAGASTFTVKATNAAGNNTKQLAITIINDGDGVDGLSIGDVVPGKGKLVWRDEFNGTSLDMTKWNHDLGAGGQYNKWGWGNEEKQWYRAENVRVQDGYLIIEASNTGSPNNSYPYTSGKIMTSGVRNTSNQTIAPPSGGFLGVSKGYVEARFRGPKGQGFWPAFWMLGANENQYMNPPSNRYSQYGWPGCSEIDIMETTGGQEGHAGQTIHFGAVPFNTSTWQYLSYDYNFTNGQGAGDVFHTYAVKWDATSLVFYVDGNINKTIQWSDVTVGGTNYSSIFTNDIPKVLIFNLAIGGNMGGGDPTTASLTSGPWENRSLTVDWVRVYEETN